MTEKGMELSTSSEILDLRHFTAAMLRAVLDAEGQIWKKRLGWDYRASARLLMQYLDNHMLPGYAAVVAEQVIGYVFCVYEETKAVIGDVFAMDEAQQYGEQSHKLEELLLKHLLELLVNSPQVDRIESQLLLHPTGSHSQIFSQTGFQIYKRLFMVQQLAGLWSAPQPNLPSELELRSWRDEDLTPAARLICDAYRNHPDSLINDQYRSVHGSMRFLNNIVRYSGCGTFSTPASHVVVHRTNREFVALVLGSRVSQESGHITQLCVHPSYRRHGLARMLLGASGFQFMRQGATEISLTVTEANQQAIDLYLSEGYDCTHKFDAAVWER
jgi:ribosomal protein S18 acetylase RimI-like enzyme